LEDGGDRAANVDLSETNAMSKKPDVWVTQRDDGRWQVRRENADRASSIHETQGAANDRAAEIARHAGVERITQGRDGKIRSKDSFGNDPASRRDREH
jgi:hypothetical protein